MQPPEDIRHLQQNMMHGGERAFKAVPLFLKNVITEEQWKHCSDREGNPFTSFEAFVAAPLWEGLESSLDDLRVFCRKNDDVRQLIDEVVGAASPHGTNRYSRPRDTLSTHNDTATGQLKRLKRDRPDLADKVVSGELSAHAAAIAAGFRKKLTPFETIEKLIPKLTVDERNALRSML